MTLAGGEYAIIELSAILSNDSETSAEALEGLNQAVANTDYRGVLNLLRERGSSSKLLAKGSSLVPMRPPAAFSITSSTPTLTAPARSLSSKS